MIINKMKKIKNTEELYKIINEIMKKKNHLKSWGKM